MSLRSIPLRLKLVTALVVPMLVAAGYLAIGVSDALAQREVAIAQQAEVARFEAVADFAGAIGAENVVVNDRSKTSRDLGRARLDTDRAMDQLRSDSVDLDAAVLEEIEAVYTELQGLRARIGDDVDEIRAATETEILSGSAEDGTVVPSLIRMADLYPLVLSSFDFAPDAIVDVRTTQLLTDFTLLQTMRAELARETSTIQRVSGLPADAITADVTEFVGTAIAGTDQSIQALRELGSADVVDQVDSFLASETFRQYSIFRNRMNDTAVGVAPVNLDPLEVQATGARVDFGLWSIADGVIAEMQAQAERTLDDANQALIRSGVIGVVLLVLIALMLRMLYRAIKSPLERLTEQSQRIAEVELPAVVSSMRRGEIDEIPEIEEIQAESNDEIGALVHAFNGMHRTAVELAAEQAGSRRVVADMFVNLGRRNQRLVNRLLKGLTVLEQHEEDPDKLASLYEIDHVATRMRRNAESLLILAGATQARRWDQPVSMYDIARAALSEVENYERVNIDTGNDMLVDGNVVADLTHLLAELVENALSFSPPSTAVDIVARSTSKGYVIAVTDRGVGMPPELLVDANRRIARAADEEETPSEFLGHYVVGRLAARHGIRVDLLDGVDGGLTARVVLPQSALASDLPADAPDQLASPAPVAAATAIEPARLDEPAEPVVASIDASAAPTAAALASPAGMQDPTVPAASFDEQPKRRRPAADAVSAETPDESPDAPPTGAAPMAPVAVPVVQPVEPVTPVGPLERPTLDVPPVRTPTVETPAVPAVDVPAPAASAPTSFDWPPADEVDPLTQAQRRRPDPRSSLDAAPAPDTGPVPMVAPADLSGLRPTEPVTEPVVEPADLSGLRPTEPVTEPVVEPVVEPADLSGLRPTEPVREPAEATLAELAARPKDEPPLAPLAGTSPTDVVRGSSPSASSDISPSDQTGELARAAEDAVNGALSAFGAARRTPGASMPNTSLISSIAGSMGSPFAGSTEPAPPPQRPRAENEDPERVRSTLAGFQLGVSRADRED